ncbi:MAG: nitroreductase family protein [Coriobacteriia bacterium]|nr:nitroreductase family protein [Coriobacteriia bacterium]
MPTMETIRARHSVRQYTDQAISGKDLAAVQQLVNQTRGKSKLDIQLVTSNPEAFNVVANFGLIRGAQALIAFVADGRDQDRTIGYWGQRLVLEAQDLGMNTCWCAVFSKRKCKATVPAGKIVRVIIALGYGVNDGKERSTKSVEQLSRVECAQAPSWFDSVMEAAQLAPTGVNLQNFTVVLQEDGRTLDVECSGKGLTGIDAGIVMANVEVAANEAGADWSFAHPIR